MRENLKILKMDEKKKNVLLIIQLCKQRVMKFNIQILTLDRKRYLYQVYAYYTTNEINKTYFFDFTCREQYQQYLT